MGLALAVYALESYVAWRQHRVRRQVPLARVFALQLCVREGEDSSRDPMRSATSTWSRRSDFLPSSAACMCACRYAFRHFSLCISECTCAAQYIPARAAGAAAVAAGGATGRGDAPPGADAGADAACLRCFAPTEADWRNPDAFADALLRSFPRSQVCVLVLRVCVYACVCVCLPSLCSCL